MSRVRAIDTRGGFVAIVVLAIACCIAPVSARAGGITQDALLVPFGARYVRAGEDVTHRGVDLAVDPGEAAEALVSGEVSFAGSVPVVTGGTMLSVTIRDSEGSLWSYLPLEAITVRAGNVVHAGESVGRVAAAGDVSSSRPHLHVGLRVSGEYADPAAYLPATHARASTDASDVEPMGVEDAAAEHAPVEAVQNVAGDTVVDIEPGAAAVGAAQPHIFEPKSPEVSHAPPLLGQHARAIDERAVQELRAAPAVSQVSPGRGLPWGWIVPPFVLVSAAGLSSSWRYRRRRRAPSEVLPDPRSTCLQPR